MPKKIEVLACDNDDSMFRLASVLQNDEDVTIRIFLCTECGDFLFKINDELIPGQFKCVKGTPPIQNIK